MSVDDNKRMAKNTVFLYVRTFASMLISLYTSRKILEALGAEDFGILNVVAGVISMLAFLNGSMSAATQRFLTFESGRQDRAGYNRMFNTAVQIHLLLAAVILIAAETLGLWFVNARLNIPAERMQAANWAYQAAILSAVLGILQTPYNASVMAHEHMHIYAYVGLGESVGKLAVVLLLLQYPYDRLVIWGFAFFALQFCVALIYRFYCSRRFKECRLRRIWDRQAFRSMIGFTGWNMFGTVAWLLKDQGTNLLMNIFGGPIVNAARGVSCQVTGAIQNLTGGFQGAVNPQLTKNYAARDAQATCRLLCQSSRISYFLLFLVALPVLLETDFILRLWLADVPPMSALFTRIILTEALCGIFGSPMITALMATGKIKWYQIVVGSLLLFNIPAAYFLLRRGYPIATPLAVSVVFVVLGNVSRILFCRRQLGLSLTRYGRTVLLPVAVVTLLASIFPWGIHHFMAEGWSRLLLTVLASCLSVSALTYAIGLSATERTFVVSWLLPRIRQFLHINR